MSTSDPISVPSPLPLGLSDPDAYIHQPQFDLSAEFNPSYAPTEQHKVSYAIAGSTDSNAPVVLWFNGMGSHRLSCLFIAGPASEAGLRVLVFDRPGAGKSTPCPLKQRFQTTYEALRAVMAQENISEFGMMSHSNLSGLLYSLYCLPRLAQSGVSVNAWVLSSAWVPPWLSGSLLLSTARHIPAALTGRLGTVAGALESSLGPIGTAFGWSSGIAKDAFSFSGSLLGMSANNDDASSQASSSTSSTTPTSPRRGKLSPEQQYILDAKKDAARPAHKKLYARRFHSPRTVDLGMKILFAEGLDSLGTEALVCLAKGDGAEWGWGHESDGSVDPKLQYERGFEAVKRAWGDAPRLAPSSIQVWYGEKDLLVPRQGREYLKGLVVDKLGLVQTEDWREIKDAGHDDPIGLTLFAESAMKLFKEAAGAGGED